MQTFYEFFLQNWIIFVIAGSLLLFIVPWLIVWSSRRSRRNLLANGRPTPAKILKLWNSGLTFGSSSSGGNNGGNMLEIHPPDEQPYLVKSRGQLHLFDISRITSGMIVEVKVAKNNPKWVVISHWSPV